MPSRTLSGLGVDAGGTGTRWALAGADGAILAEGSVDGMSANQLSSSAGSAAMRETLAQLGAQARQAGQPGSACVGLTGFDGVVAEPAQWLAAALEIAPTAVTLRSDIEIACLAAFQPGEGYLVYAGTGSIAAWFDADGVFHRAGGRGVTLDDGGGGFWIAREAMRHIWRREDEQPGAWRQSLLAQTVFAQVGGSDWAQSRQFIYGQERGAIGQLALAVAAAADADPQARAILAEAGRELARLALALVQRSGPRPIALGGRVADLHPLILESMQQALPATLPVTRATLPAHHAAARLALARA